MITIKCQHSGLEFEANSKRTKQHPDVAAFKNEAASKRGDYNAALKALDEAAQTGNYKTIEEYMHLVNDIYTGANKAKHEAEKKRLEAEAKARQELADRKAKRQAQNAFLRENGYVWKKEEIFDFDQMEEYDPRYAKFEWTLYAPDGRAVTVSQALDEIERGIEAVQTDLVEIIENDEKLPYDVILTDVLKQADDRRRQAEKEGKETRLQAWEVAKDKVKAEMAEVESFDRSGFEIVYEYKAYAQHTGRIYQGQINGIDCAIIYSYHGGHDFYQTEQFYCINPDQAGLTKQAERASLEASWHKFFGE